VRLFAAIDLSAATRAAMAAEQQRISTALGQAGEALKWVRPDNAHLTLVFLGQVDEGRVPLFVEDFGRDINRRPFEMTFAGIGVFPERGAPRVLWAGLGAGTEAVIAVQRELASRASRHGVALEAREFHPHLTLARWSSSRPSDRGCVRAAAAAGILARQRVTSATLYHSRLLPSGPRYTALAHANLTGAC
jgi:RNA 2',3'-cyclic 3'-phosphodiesterase